MSKLEIVFEENDTSCDKFCKQILMIIRFFIGQNLNGLCMLFLEIFRNIYDHANGTGKIVLIKNTNSIKFIIFDFGKGNKLTKIRNDKVNFGAGVSMIKDIAESLGIELKVDTSKGFYYEGIYYIK
ncbi:MAG: hypothetical protein WC827_04510 [Candidatus Paceibacterota bacterium]|jgi:hypothetical protein